MRPSYKLAEKIIDEKDIENLRQWLAASPQLTKGPLTPQFDNEWAKWV